jgi:large conductance mechanosensitive channel
LRRGSRRIVARNFRRRALVDACVESQLGQGRVCENSAMKKLMAEFKAFAFGGNLVDLAIGFIIGGAFALVVESLAKNVIGDLIAALGGQPDLSSTVIHVRHGDVHIGLFLGDLLSFAIVAFVLLMIVKALKRIGMGNFKAQGLRECDACKEFVAVDATRCRYCTSDLMPIVTDAD